MTSVRTENRVKLALSLVHTHYVNCSGFQKLRNYPGTIEDVIQRVYGIMDGIGSIIRI